MAAFHGAALVSLITFLPIYLRAVRGLSPSETGFMLLPLTAGIGIGSMATGQLVTRTGHTAMFPTVGLIGGNGEPRLARLLDSLSQRRRSSPGRSAIIALFMGTVMGVVQVTVQSVSGPRLLGTGAAMVQFSRSVGAAFGTATVAAVLFSILTATDRDTATLFGSIIERGPEAIAALIPRDRPSCMRQIADAFHAAFLMIAGFTGDRGMVGLVAAAATICNFSRAQPLRWAAAHGTAPAIGVNPGRQRHDRRRTGPSLESQHAGSALAAEPRGATSRTVHRSRSSCR